jgi:hypothetical protein
MSLTTEQPAASPQCDEPPCYEITIRTWITDPNAAAHLAVQISESLADNEQIDATASMIGVEDTSADERERVYAEVAGPPPDLRARERG